MVRSLELGAGDVALEELGAELLEDLQNQSNGSEDGRYC